MIYGMEVFYDDGNGGNSGSIHLTRVPSEMDERTEEVIPVLPLLTGHAHAEDFRVVLIAPDSSATGREGYAYGLSETVGPSSFFRVTSDVTPYLRDRFGAKPYYYHPDKEMWERVPLDLIEGLLREWVAEEEMYNLSSAHEALAKELEKRKALIAAIPPPPVEETEPAPDRFSREELF